MEDFAKWFSRHSHYVHHVVLNRPQIAIEYIDVLAKYPKVHVIYYGHDIHHLRIADQLKLQSFLKLKKEQAYWEKLEKQIWGQVDIIYYPSDTETDYVRRLQPQKICRTVPAYSLRSFGRVGEVTCAGRKDLLFVAGFGHPPNVDAACWFVQDIFPQIRARLPGIQLYLVGSNPTREVLALAEPGITVTGFVPDERLDEFYRRARVGLAPLRYGAGVKGKVVESLCKGLPQVSTSTGVQGLAGLEKIIPVSDDPAEFAVAVVKLCTDDSAWMECAQWGLQYAQARFSEVAIDRVLREDLKLDDQGRR